MAGYENNTKIIESYETLAKLLNSDKKENIDKAYDALRAIADSEYTASVKQTEQSYAKSRDVLAVNRAKADKYMNYFLSKGGYDGSGIAADAKLKSELNYASQVSELNSEQRAAEQSLAQQRKKSLNDIESKRAEEQTRADEAMAELEYKLASDRAELEYKVAADKAERELRLKEMENESYWRNKEYELKKLVADRETSSSSGTSGSGTSGDESLKEMISGYRTLLYNGIIDDFGQAKTADEMETIYNTVTGVNAEKAINIFGQSLYNKMIKDMKVKLMAQKKEEEYEAEIVEIFNRLVESPDVGQTMASLQYNANFSKNPKYDRDQIDMAFKRYHNFKTGEYDFSEEYKKAASK